LFIVETTLSPGQSMKSSLILDFNKCLLLCYI